MFPTEMCLTPLPGRSLEAQTEPIDQPLASVRDHQLDAAQAPLLEPSEGLRPALVGLGVRDPHAEDLSVALLVHADQYQRTRRPHSPLPTDFELHRVDEDERILKVVEGPLVPRLDLLVEILREVAHRRLGELSTTQLLGDLFDLPGRDAIEDHFHHRQYQRLLASLISVEQCRAERPVPSSRHPQLDRADAGCQSALIVPVPPAGAVFRALSWGVKLRLYP